MSTLPWRRLIIAAHVVLLGCSGGAPAELEPSPSETPGAAPGLNEPDPLPGEPLELAPELDAPPTPDAPPRPPEAPAPPTAVGPAGWRAFVHGGVVVACADGAQHKDGADCAGPMQAVSLYRPFGGEVRLSLQPMQPAPAAPPGCAGARGATLEAPAARLPIRRSMTSMPLDNNTYTRLVAEVTGQAKPQLTALLRVDLDGDGQHEVLFAADSHPGPKSSPEAPSQAAVALRGLGPSGAPETLFFFQRAAPVDPADPVDQVRGSLLGFTDLDGDGALDVVVEDAHPGGVERSVWRLRGGALERLGGQACGA